MMPFILFMSLLISLRLIEMVISKRNERWLKAHGAVESGEAHYPFLISMHVLFMASLAIEYTLKPEHIFILPLFITFLLLTIAKVIIGSSLGRYWTTKIYRIPGTPIIRKGVYKYFNHPSYLIVVIEIVVIPLMFHLYYTAIIFSILNLVILSIRIRKENKALND